MFASCHVNSFMVTAFCTSIDDQANINQSHLRKILCRSYICRYVDSSKALKLSTSEGHIKLPGDICLESARQKNRVCRSLGPLILVLMFDYVQMPISIHKDCWGTIKNSWTKAVLKIYSYRLN